MSEAAICCGCFVNHPPTWHNPYNTPYQYGPDSAVPYPDYKPTPPNVFPTFTLSEGLTQEEKDCLKHLADAWNCFSQLSGKHPSDNAEFLQSIHDAQKMIALRVARRIDKDVWSQWENA